MKLAAVDIPSVFGSPFGVTRTAGGLVTALLNNALVVAGAYMLFLFVSSGLAIIKGAGESKPETVAKGKQTLTTALIGFAIIFGTYWIVKVIGIVSGLENDILNPSI